MPGRHVDVQVTGTPDEVAEILHRQQAAGDLVLVSAPRRLNSGQIAVTVRTYPAPAAAPATGPAGSGWRSVVRSCWAPALVVVMALAALATVGFVVWQVALFVAAWWPLLLLAGGLLAWWLLSSGGRSCC
ncbi:hypothetical protein [Pilimelia anulata]|nr:hypothetical protein [Pilimelia anulata]